MKNIFDALSKGDLDAVGDTLKNVMNNVGEKLPGTAQTVGGSVGAIGDALKGALGGNIPGGFGGL
ncbi:MAG: hypothetical protein K2O70_05565, partial [Desulfovibrionaceae bacterium]|nr:hypothetical protein [Desulfovibrionaceae bacterium]